MKIPNTDEVRDHFLAAFADIFPEASDWDLTQAVNAVTSYSYTVATPKAKAMIGIPQVKNTKKMGDEELRKYYAGRAAFDDVDAFMGRTDLHVTALHAREWAALVQMTMASGGKYTPAIRKEYARLKGLYWTEKPVGAEGWFPLTLAAQRREVAA